MTPDALHLTSSLVAASIDLRTLSLDPKQFIGIPIALVGAVFLSVGAQLQHRGVSKVDAHTVADASAGGLNLRQLRMLLSRPSWVTGSLMLGLAVVLQLTSLAFAPLIVVQPVGAFGLVVTSVMNARLSGIRLGRWSILAIVLCVGGVGAFVLIAAFQAREVPIAQHELAEIIVILGVVLALFAVGFGMFRRRLKAIVYVVGAGVLYGFVATLAKVVIARLQQHDFTWLTALCIVALVAAVCLGAYFVQNAYASGPPDLVIAGLTVIDPLVAVTIGIGILREATQAPVWALAMFVVTGAIAIIGVFLVARHHPQVKA